MAIAAGYDHSLALKSDGTVWAWGGNASGQLGDGTTTQRTSPVQVLGLVGVTGLAGGDAFSVAVQRDGASGGTAWTWGANTLGQLGDGSTVSRSVAVKVQGVTGIAQVTAGQSFVLALINDGTVRGWGENDRAQLGTMTPASSPVPVVVPALARIRSLSAGNDHGLALDADGRVWGWGANDSGQLGAVSYTYPAGIAGPTLIPGAVAVVYVAGGWLHTLVLHADGSVSGTGSDIPTGLGTSIYRSITPLTGHSLVTNTSLTTDADGDGLFAWEEYLAGTDPLSVDSNGNGLSDLVDVRRGSQVGNADDDGDGVPNVLEIAAGTDPFAADTDGDGYSDLLDAFPLDPTRHDPLTANPSDTTPPTIILTRPETAVPL